VFDQKEEKGTSQGDRKDDKKPHNTITSGSSAGTANYAPQTLDKTHGEKLSTTSMTSPSVERKEDRPPTLHVPKEEDRRSAPEKRDERTGKDIKSSSTAQPSASKDRINRDGDRDSSTTRREGDQGEDSKSIGEGTSDSSRRRIRVTRGKETATSPTNSSVPRGPPSPSGRPTFEITGIDHKERPRDQADEQQNRGSISSAEEDKKKKKAKKLIH